MVLSHELFKLVKTEGIANVPSDWMYNFPNPGWFALAFGVLFGVLTLFNYLRRSELAATGMLVATTVSLWWGGYTLPLTQKLGPTPAGVPLPVRTGDQYMLIASAVSALLLVGLASWLGNHGGRSFQAVFAFSGGICVAACSAYQWQLWLVDDSRLKLAVTVLESLAGVVFVIGLIVAQAMLFAALREARDNVEYWMREASTRQVLPSQRVTTEVIRTDHS